MELSIEKNREEKKKGLGQSHGQFGTKLLTPPPLAQTSTSTAHHKAKSKWLIRMTFVFCLDFGTDGFEGLSVHLCQRNTF